MARIKVSDLEVTKRNIPLLIFVEPRETYYYGDEPKLPVLHICNRVGTRAKHSRYSITECNRPLKYVNVYHHGTLDISRYRLCVRCAKEQSVFEDTLAEHHKQREILAQQRKKTDEQKRQEQQEEREALRERLNDFGSEFFEELPAAWVGPKNEPYALRIEYKGQLYEIQEVDK